jgi:hypothetical protein
MCGFEHNYAKVTIGARRNRRIVIATRSPLEDLWWGWPINPLHFVETGVMDRHAPTKRRKDSPP